MPRVYKGFVENNDLHNAVTAYTPISVVDNFLHGGNIIPVLFPHVVERNYQQPQILQKRREMVASDGQKLPL